MRACELQWRGDGWYQCAIAQADGPDALEMALRLATELLANTPNDGLGNRLPVG